METREWYGNAKRQNPSSSFSHLEEKMPLWNPFGRPGAGAPKSTENHARLAVCYIILSHVYR